MSDAADQQPTNPAREREWQESLDLANERRRQAVAPLNDEELDLLANAVHSERGYYTIRDAVNDILQARADA